MWRAVKELPTVLGVVLACVARAGGAPGEEHFAFSLDDDFTGYAEGSDASPAWETGSICWEARRISAPDVESGAITRAAHRGAFTCDEPSKDFAFPARAPLGKRVRVSAELALGKTTSSGWKIAGLCVRKDERNYWHLALVEAPDKDGKRHFVELTEMLDGLWLAQSHERTRLTQTESKGQTFDWRYGRTYRLTIELTPSGITGAVEERDGTVRARIAYAFDLSRAPRSFKRPNARGGAAGTSGSAGAALTGAKKAVMLGRPGLTSGGFTTEFRRFSARVGSPVAEEGRKVVRQPYESRGFREIRARATGYFHVEEIGGSWWVIDPAGNGFFIVGTDHVNYNVHWCEKLGHAPYHRNCERKHGSAERWSESTVPRLLSWGFNCVGVNSSPEVRYKGLAHMTNLRLGTRFAERDWITPKTTWTGFPNVFSPKFRAFCEKTARRLCAPNRDDPWLIGYFIDNELEWHAWTGGGPFADSFRKPGDHSAKRALVGFFRERYAAPEEWGRAWGTKIADFDDLPGMTEPPAAGTDAAREDVREFMRLIADRYFAVTSAAIRKHDPNHMIMGSRFAGGAPDIWDIAGKYCDVFSINCYRRVDLERGVMADDFEEDLERWHGRVKRPLMITEWSFPALDAGLPCRHGAGQRVPTQKDKAFAFTVFQKLLFSTPWVVGSNYFMWADEPELGISSTFPEDSNYGLVNVNDEPYELVTQAAARLNPLACRIHRGELPDLSVRPGEEPGSFVVENAGRARGSSSAIVWPAGAAEKSEIVLPPGKSARVEPPAGILEGPGGEFFVCEIEPREPLLEKSMEGKRATQVFYVPGAPWRARAKSRFRVPFVVANPTAEKMWNARVSMKLAEVPGSRAIDWTGLSAVDAETGAVLPFQVDKLEGGGELALALADPLGPRSARTVFLYDSYADLRGGAVKAVSYREVGDGFEIDSGAFLFVKTSRKDGNAFERVVLHGRPGGLVLGRFTPLVWQEVGQNLWIGPDRVDEVEVFRGLARLVVDITCSRGGPGGKSGETKTRVDDEGRSASLARGPRRFRLKWRFVVYPDRKWFESRLVWIENTDDVPWRLEGYYHYAVSNIGGDAADDEARGDRWLDKAADACYGVIPGSDDIRVTFWKDKGGGEHADAFRKLGIALAPGERYEKPEPTGYVVGCREGEWDEVAREIASFRKVMLRAFEPERR